MATFLDSDDNFMVYRRFGYMQSRILLARQERLRRLEIQLDELDKDQVSRTNNSDLLCKAKIGGEMEVEREKLMLEIEKEYFEYGRIPIFRLARMPLTVFKRTCCKPRRRWWRSANLAQANGSQWLLL